MLKSGHVARPSNIIRRVTVLSGVSHNLNVSHFVRFIWANSQPTAKRLHVVLERPGNGVGCQPLPSTYVVPSAAPAMRALSVG